MPRERILICGAGIAGSVLAFWLAKYDFEVVVVERAKAEQKAGQGLEIEEPALEVVKMMGILSKLQENRTAETGFELVDERARSWGILEIGAASPTGALELMRGDLTEILYNAANEFAAVTYRFETTIQSLRQTSHNVSVEIRDRVTAAATNEEFDLVIGADGVKSRIRELVMGPAKALNCFKRIGAYVAYFSIPKEDRDWPLSRLCHFPDRRIVWIRPAGKHSETTSVYIIHGNDDIPELRRANDAGDRQQQKQIFAEIYKDLGWEVPRIIEQMMKADNFYSDELAQVKLPSWSRDRVALLGDAAWAPTPFSGEGNQLAIIGAWVLAQELSRNRDKVAFEMYEKRLRSYVEGAQQIPLRGYAPSLFIPKTYMGISLFRTIFYFVAAFIDFFYWTKVPSILPSQQSAPNHPPFDLQAENVRP